LAQNNSQKVKPIIKIKILIFVKIVENLSPLGTHYNYTIEGVLCIPIPQLLKFYKIKFETAEPGFLK
jgi:hypothetical protein